MSLQRRGPYSCRPRLELKPDQYNRLRVRMKLPPCSPTAQFFWTNIDDPMFSDTKYVQFPVQPDGAWHEHEISVTEHAQWKRKAIRLDPTVGGAEVGSKLAIDWIVGE